MTDIDLDFANRQVALDLFHGKYVSASLDGTKKHNSGVYFQKIPYNPLNGVSTIDYKTAGNRGYFKIDFLNVGVYGNITSRDQLKELMNREPIWELLEDDEFLDMIFQLNGHGDIVRTMKPRNVEQLAAVLAMIRPAKKYLIGKPWPEVLENIWKEPDNDEYYWKKSHAFSYAMVVIVQVNLVCQTIASTNSSTNTSEHAEQVEQTFALHDEYSNSLD